MAEVIGLVASVASLIAFTSETSKACHKLAESTASFKNAQTDIRNISAELLDLAQILELIESVLHPLQDDKIGVQGHVDLVDRSLARIKTSVHEIADILTAVQPTAKGSSTRIRAKWMYKKNGIESMMAVIDKQKQGLLLQFNLLNAKYAHKNHGELEDFRKDLKQVGQRTQDLTASITTSISESISRFENIVQASATSLKGSIRDEIHQTVLSVPRESNISQASLQTLSVLVSNTVASQFESLESQTSLKYPESRSCTQVESAQRQSNEPQTADVRAMISVSQATTVDFRNDDSSRFRREGGSSSLISRSSVQTMTSVFGRVIIRRSAVKITYLDSDPEYFSEGDKVEIDFLPASWLRYWTGCGIFLARMGFGKPTVDVNFTVARVLDFNSDLDTQEALGAVKIGDVPTLIGFLQRKVIYPTDRDVHGNSLLSIAADSKQLEICELLLQQGAAVDINTPNFSGKLYPIERAISSSTTRNDHDFVRLFLKYDADITIDMSAWNFAMRGNVMTCFTMRSFTLLPLLYGCAETHESKTLFRLLVDNDPSFDINHREKAFYGDTIVLARAQPLQIYKDLIMLGANVKALAHFDDTVLHEFFNNLFCATHPAVPIDTFLDGGEILALLIQAGADPQATDQLGRRPEDVPRTNSFFPDRRVAKRVYLAIWHQGLKICGLLGSKYCHCPIHHREKTNRRDVDSNFPPRRRGLDKLLPYDNFEEEISAALRGWDKSVTQRSYRGNGALWGIGTWENWIERCELYDEWIQEVLIELQARQKKASPKRDVNASLSVEGPSKRTDTQNFERDEMQASDHLNMNRSVLHTHESDSDKDWETSSSSSSNGEEEWESAPEA